MYMSILRIRQYVQGGHRGGGRPDPAAAAVTVLYPGRRHLMDQFDSTDSTFQNWRPSWCKRLISAGVRPVDRYTYRLELRAPSRYNIVRRNINLYSNPNDPR